MTAPIPPELRDAPLGHATSNPDRYDRSLLFRVARAPQRAVLGIAAQSPFSGVDLWTAYDLTWLDARGRPRVAIGSFAVDADSAHIVESKSMKLYLGSFAQSRFGSAEEVARVIGDDLSAATGVRVDVTLHAPDDYEFANPVGESLDGLDIECDRYAVDATLLEAGTRRVTEKLRTDLFRSVCPVTGQPDIASVQIDYAGPQIDRTGLLRYLVSYRDHPGFHEHCVERIFVDIGARCRPEQLAVYARFTRRGGIDINPYRSNAGRPWPRNLRTARQ